MRRFAFLLVIGSSVPLFAGATTQPATGDHAQPQVAVFSFVNAGPEGQAWIGQAIEENFIAELSRGGIVSPVRAVADSKDPNGAMTTAKNSGATYLLTGAYQLVGDELRATGQIVAVNDGHVVGGLTATGGSRDLFSIEDTLAMQAKRLVEPPTAPMAAVRPIQGSGPLAATPGPVVSNDFSAAAYQPAAAYGPQYNQYYYYTTPYAYSGYGYGGAVLIGGYGYGGCGYRGGYVGGFHGGFGGHGHITWGGAGVVGRSGW